LFIVTAIVALIPVVWWCFYWAPMLTVDYGLFYFFMGSDIRTSLGFLMSEWQTVFKCFYFDAIGYVGFVFYVTGMIYLIIKKERKLLFALSGVFVLQIIFMIKSGESFIKHSYYMIPFIPIMAICAGYFISLIKLKWLRSVFLLAFVVEGVLNFQHDFMPKQLKNYLLQLENIAVDYTNPSDLIVINNTLNPRGVYLAHRKGWGVKSNVASDSNYLKNIVQKGANYLFGIDILLNCLKVFRTLKLYTRQKILEFMFQMTTLKLSFNEFS